MDYKEQLKVYFTARGAHYYTEFTPNVPGARACCSYQSHSPREFYPHHVLKVPARLTRSRLQWKEARALESSKLKVT